MSIPKNIILTSSNLKLRIASLEDIPHIFSATRYKGFNDGMLWDPPENEEECVQPYYNGIRSWEKGLGYGFTIENKISSDFFGRISIRKTKIDHRWNIGFWTHPRHQKTGIMTESVKVILDFGFEKLNAKTIEAAHAIWNKGSEKVLTRNGMKFIRFIEKGYKKNGEWVNENLLAISKEEWKKLF